MPQVTTQIFVLFWIFFNVVRFDMDTVGAGSAGGLGALAAKLNPERRRGGRRYQVNPGPEPGDAKAVGGGRGDRGDGLLLRSIHGGVDSPEMEGPFQRIRDVRRLKSGRKQQSKRSRKRMYPLRRRNRNRQTEDSSRDVGQSQQEQLLRLMREMQKTASKIEGWTQTLSELSAEPDLLYEKDIMLTPEQARLILQDLQHETQEHRKRKKRKLAQPLSKRWTLPIPYIFDGSHSSQERYRIQQALAYWEELTCIRFKEDPTAMYKVEFTRQTGCWSYVGFTKNINQTVSIGSGCQSNGTIAHEIGHVIGFWHEQSRPDRDDYVYIIKDNVDPTERKIVNFDKRTWGEIVTMDIPYDLGSDMHYGSTYYSKDANSTASTIGTLDPLMYRVIGQRQELSFFDIKLANKAYCKDICNNHSLNEPCRREGYQDPSNCTQCRCPDGFSGRYCELLAPALNDQCGGVYDAKYNGTIFSPGYPLGYSSDMKCTWLIKAPVESHVYLQFAGKFGISGHVDVCKDFVEVRYNTSLALTGARFCCADVPKRPIKSDSHEMLILFRSFKESRTCDDVFYSWKCQQLFTGFKAFYWTKSCGGCQDPWEEKQPACKKRVSYACAESWQEKVKVDCPTWWYTEGCGQQTVTRSRYGMCFKDQLYCCDSFELDGEVCKALYPRSSNLIPVTPRTFNNNNKEPDSVIPVIPPTKTKVSWTDWSDFGRCSRPCGGGYMVRSRKCISPGSCGASDIQAEQRSCNTVPCYRKCPVKKRVLCDLWTTCTKTVYEYCRPYCFKGYILHQAQCERG